MYLVTSGLKNHVSVMTINDLENELLKFPGWEKKNAIFTWAPEVLLKKISRLIKKIKVKNSFFAVIMDIAVFHRRVFPFLTINSFGKAIYLFDAWEPLYLEIHELLVEYNFDLIFISAKKTAEYFSKVLNDKKVFWIPEGITTEHYYFENYEDKTIEILQMGRKYQLYHDNLVGYCEANNLNYLYEKKPGELIFNSQESFSEALAKTKISICFPSSITHPERSGTVSTVTQRYYQSMISKCIIVGESPSEMKELFSYDAVIKADLKYPGEQIRDILKNYEDYKSLLERNYNEVLLNHHWRNRAKSIAEIIKSHKKTYQNE
jgi:hypothetical protein